MKRSLFLLLSIMTLALCLAGCSGLGPQEDASTTTSTTSTTTTTTSSTDTTTTTTSTTTSTTTTIPEISSWTFVDDGGSDGINYSKTSNASGPKLAVFDSNLFAIWNEQAGSIYQIRVAAYNGSSWSFADGNGANGINKDVSRNALVPHLAVHNSKLYAIWQETNGTAKQIRVKVYKNPGWDPVDGDGTGGINKDINCNAEYPRLIEYNSKLYATWQEYNGTTYQVRVKVYDDPGWSLVDGGGTGGINKDQTKSAYGPRLAVLNGKLYATWYEDNGTAALQIRVAVYDGNDSSPGWTFVDGNSTNGINKVSTNDANCATLAVNDGKLYASWYESNGGMNQIRVAVYNGDDNDPHWNFVDGTNGLIFDPAQNAVNSELVSCNGKLYATWRETNPTNEVRVAVYNGNDSSPGWTFVDGNSTNGLNKDTTMPVIVPQLVPYNSKLYAAWDERNSSNKNQIRVKVGQ